MVVIQARTVLNLAEKVSYFWHYLFLEWTEYYIFLLLFGYNVYPLLLVAPANRGNGVRSTAEDGGHREWESKICDAHL